MIVEEYSCILGKYCVLWGKNSDIFGENTVLFGANAMHSTGFEEQSVTSEESATYLRGVLCHQVCLQL